MATATPARPDDSPERQRELDLPVHRELLRRGFHLGYFFLRDREITLEVLGIAMSKLEAQRSLETNRYRWRGRSLKGKITRIVREEQDTFQWLVCSAATRYEIRQEELNPQSTRNLITRYVKFLIQNTAAMSSFYVSVGLQRLLYNYSTPETQKSYEWLTEYYPGAEEYRAVKGKLMKKIEKRFDEYLTIVQASRRELRFEPLEQQEDWKNLVEQCLRLLTPWSTHWACLAWPASDSGANVRPQLKRSPDVSQDEVETGSCHIFIDPDCFTRLTRRLELDLPWQRLAVPRFRNTGDGSHDDSMNDDQPEITEEEMQAIMSRTADERIQRRQIEPRFLRIVADEVEYAKIDLVGPSSKGQCEIPDFTKLIEIWSVSEEGSVLLATHWINYTKWSGAAQARATVDVGKGRALLLEINPVAETSEKEACIALGLRCQPASLLATWRESLTSARLLTYSLPKYALVAASLAMIAWFGAAKYRRNLLEQQATIERISKELAQERDLRASAQRINAGSVNATATYSLIPAEFINRGSHGRKELVVAVAAQQNLVVLNLLVGDSTGAPYRAVLKSDSKDLELLSENLLQPLRTNGDIAVSFPVPAALLESGHSYVVDLYSMKGLHVPEKIDDFTFTVVKK